MKTFSISLKESWKSSNFWVWVGLLISSMFIGSQDIAPDVEKIVGAIFAIIGGGAAIRNRIKDGEFKFEWSRITNLIGYVGLIINSLVSFAIPEQLWTDLSTIAENLIAGNWTGAIGAVLSAIVIIANIFKNKKKEEIASISIA